MLLTVSEVFFFFGSFKKQISKMKKISKSGSIPSIVLSKTSRKILSDSDVTGFTLPFPDVISPRNATARIGPSEAIPITQKLSLFDFAFLFLAIPDASASKNGDVTIPVVEPPASNAIATMLSGIKIQIRKIKANVERITYL